MARRTKNSKLPHTIYLTKDISEYVYNCAETSGRGISAEVEHAIKVVKGIREKANEEAFKLMEMHKQ